MWFQDWISRADRRRTGRTSYGKNPRSKFPHYVFHISAQFGRFWRRRRQHHTPSVIHHWKALVKAEFWAHLTRTCDKYLNLISRFTGSWYHIFVFPWKGCMLFWLFRAPRPNSWPAFWKRQIGFHMKMVCEIHSLLQQQRCFLRFYSVLDFWQVNFTTKNHDDDPHSKLFYCNKTVSYSL